MKTNYFGMRFDVVISRMFLFLGEMTAGVVLSELMVGKYSREAVLAVYLAAIVLYRIGTAKKRIGLDYLFWGIGVLAVTAPEGLKVSMAVWVASRILGLSNRHAIPAAVISLPVFISLIYPHDLLLITTTLGMVIINRHLFSPRLI